MNTEDMKKTWYFSHDYSARNDPKLQSVLCDHGLAGIGLYWCLVEQLYEQGGTIKLDMLRGISFSLHADAKMAESLLRDYSLFKDDGEVFWSESVKARLKEREEFSKKKSDAGKKGMQRRWTKQSNNTVITEILHEDNTVITNKVNKNKEKDLSQSKDFLCPNLASEACDAVSEPRESEHNSKVDLDVVAHADAVRRGAEDSALCEAVRKYYNETLAEKGSRMKRSTVKLSGQRREYLLARVDEYGKEKVKECIDKAAASRFLGGDNERGFTADIEWIMRPNNFQKVIDGRYDNREKKGECVGQNYRDNNPNRYKNEKGW